MIDQLHVQVAKATTNIYIRIDYLNYLKLLMQKNGILWSNKSDVELFKNRGRFASQKRNNQQISMKSFKFQHTNVELKLTPLPNKAVLSTQSESSNSNSSYVK